MSRRSTGNPRPPPSSRARSSSCQCIKCGCARRLACHWQPRIVQSPWKAQAVVALQPSPGPAWMLVLLSIWPQNFRLLLSLSHYLRAAAVAAGAPGCRQLPLAWQPELVCKHPPYSCLRNRANGSQAAPSQDSYAMLSPISIGGDFSKLWNSENDIGRYLGSDISAEEGYSKRKTATFLLCTVGTKC